jgi:hypothetical protein
VKSDTFKGVQRPVYIKTLPGRGGTVSNVWYDTLTIGWNTDALDVTTNYGSSSIPPHNTSLLPTVKSVTIQNITATGSSPVYEFIGLSAKPFSNILLNNVHLTGTNGTCKTAAGIKLQNTTLTGVPSGSTTLPCQ